MVISLLAEGRDHPRECGKNKLVRGIHSWIKGSPPRVREKPKRLAVFVLPVGSPPRVREKQEAFKDDVLEFRITPASAGKTCSTFQ